MRRGKIAGERLQTHNSCLGWNGTHIHLGLLRPEWTHIYLGLIRPERASHIHLGLLRQNRTHVHLRLFQEENMVKQKMKPAKKAGSKAKVGRIFTLGCQPQSLGQGMPC